MGEKHKVEMTTRNLCPYLFWEYNVFYTLTRLTLCISAACIILTKHPIRNITNKLLLAYYFKYGSMSSALLVYFSFRFN
jgi:hypothetical protein